MSPFERLAAQNIQDALHDRLMQVCQQKANTPCVYPGGCFPGPADCEYAKHNFPGCAEARLKAVLDYHAEGAVFPCPRHGNQHMIAFSDKAMWHPSTGESEPSGDMVYSCTKVVKTRRFLFWKWDVRCDFQYTVRRNL